MQIRIYLKGGAEWSGMEWNGMEWKKSTEINGREARNKVSDDSVWCFVLHQ